MELIDYFQSYCELAAGMSVPVQRRGKYILVKNHDLALLLLGMPELHPYHADIMAAYCGREGIRYRRDEATGQVVPKKPKVHVMGGGRYEIDDAAMTLRLHDYSTAYGPPDPSLLPKDKIAGYTVDLSGCP